MPSYADSHPVPRSPFSDGQGPVHLSISGMAEDVVETSLGMDIDWETQLRIAHNSVRLEQLGWRAGDWTPAVNGQALTAGRGALVILCLDSNVLISHLALLKAVHQALVSAFETGASGFTFLVPSTVLRELDGLKTSSAPADHRGGPTIGDLAQRAVAWLVDVKRMERAHGIGRGLLVGDELDMSSQYALEDNDGLILAAALDTLKRSRKGTRLILWTADTNLQARAELQGLPTLPVRRPPPANPHVFLDSLGVRPAEAGMLEVDMEVGSTDAPPAHRSPPPAKATPPRLLVVSRARQRLPPPTLSPPPKQPAPPSFDHLPPFEAILLIMETHFPPAVIGRLTTFQQLARSAYDDAGLPRLEDLRQMTLTLPMCFQILELIWRHQEGGWRSSDLVPRRRRRPKPDLPSLSPPRAPTALPPKESRQQSMHARPLQASRQAKRSLQSSPRGRQPAEPPDADLLPPSAAHIRTHLLPALSHFCSQPFVGGMPDFLEALEAIFLGPGGRAFLGSVGYPDFAQGVERCWLHLSEGQ